MEKAKELGVDLVEIAPMAKPPVAKLIPFSKFKYQLQQKESEEKKKTKNAKIKELRLTPFMADGDFTSRVSRAKEFFANGDKVRFVVKFKGRQITKKEFGDKILAKVVETLYDVASVEIQPKQLGKIIMMQMSPVKKVAGKASSGSKTSTPSVETAPAEPTQKEQEANQ